MVESSDKTWSTGEVNGKPLQDSCLENPMNSMKKEKAMTLKNELPRLVGAQYATGDQWRNNSRKNKGMEPKQKQHPVMDLTFQVPMQYCSTASDFTSIISLIHNWVLFLLWLCLFILSGVISPLIYSSILGTYRPEEFIFQYAFYLFILFMGISRQEY